MPNGTIPGLQNKGAAAGKNLADAVKRKGPDSLSHPVFHFNSESGGCD